jgi:hypothetical protein
LIAVLVRELLLDFFKTADLAKASQLARFSARSEEVCAVCSHETSI